MILVITPLIDMFGVSSPPLTFERDCITLPEACKCFFEFLSFRELLFSLSAFASADQKDNDRRNYNDDKHFIGT